MIGWPAVVGPDFSFSSRGVKLSSSDSPVADSSSEMGIDQKVNQILDKVRPALVRHGGGAELVSSDDGIIVLRVLGACKGCAMSAFTFQLGIEKILREKYKDEIKEVRYV